MLSPISLKAIDNRVVTDITAADLQKTISQSPAAFELLLIRAELDSHEEQTDVEDVVSNVEHREAIISYQSPVLTKALQLPVDLGDAYMLASGADSLDEPEEPICLLIDEQDIPEQSVVWIEEAIADDETKVSTFYLLHSRPIGKNGLGGAKHYFVPFTGYLGGFPEPEQTSPVEEPEVTPERKAPEDESVTVL